MTGDEELVSPTLDTMAPPAEAPSALPRAALRLACGIEPRVEFINLEEVRVDRGI